MTKPSGFTADQVAAILLRDGDQCAMQGYDPNCRRRATTANHRANRGSGGYRGGNGLANGCAICDHCNDLIERDALAAQEARRRGVKISRYDDTEAVELWSAFFGQFIRVTDTAAYLTGRVLS